MRQSLLIVVLLGLAGCTSSNPIIAANDGIVRPPTTLAAAHDLDFTETSEVIVRGEVIGYVKTLLELPEGTEDKRAWPTGTMLVQDPALEWIGFVSPRGASYRFDEQGNAKPVGAGSKLGSVGRMLGTTEIPKLRTVSPGAGS